MRVLRHASAADFLVRTEAFRAANPVLTNIIGSVAAGVVAGRAYDAELWLTVHEDSSSEPVGIAMRTSPYNLVASPMPSAAARELGRQLALIDPGLPGVSGTREVAEALVSGLGADDRARVGMLEKLRVLSELRAPRHECPGRARPVSAQDHDLVVGWLHDFGVEAGLHVTPSREDIRADLEASRGSALWIWEAHGRPVALGGHAPLVTTPAGTVARIGPIYTPVAERGRGYGTAITHALAVALGQADVIIMLYADAANATSNSVYEHLGFAVVAEWVEVTLDVDPRTVTGPA